MSPSPPKHRDKSMRPSTSGWSKLTSRKYVCCQMLQVYRSCSLLLYPSAVRHVTYNIVGLHKERLGASLTGYQTTNRRQIISAGRHVRLIHARMLFNYFKWSQMLKGKNVVKQLCYLNQPVLAQPGKNIICML